MASLTWPVKLWLAAQADETVKPTPRTRAASTIPNFCERDIIECLLLESLTAEDFLSLFPAYKEYQKAPARLSRAFKFLVISSLQTAKSHPLFCRFRSRIDAGFAPTDPSMKEF